MSNKKDTFSSTLLVVFAVCLVCSVIVAGAAVGLRPMQIANKALDKQKNILAVAGVESDKSATEIFESNIQTKVIDLKTGLFVDSINGKEIDAAKYDQRAAAKDPATSIKLSAGDNIAKIGRRANFATVYLVYSDENKLQRVILPVHGSGLWAQMYSFIALEADGNTVASLTYYEHGETPGLGGEITNPRWRALWVGKQMLDGQGNPALKVIKGQAPKGDLHKVDGLSGATLTSNAVQHAYTFWLGKKGFGPFLKRVREGELNNG
ncbi:MAG TPA: Na(+)-translocating NADH-quinone reductase subunit C [Psychromonas hadalis]|nr:Na(+)-translocating NADH-quinone reductase subunit C [Psychromonas hadalis]